METSHASQSERYCPTCDGSFPEDSLRCPNDGTSLIKLIEERDKLLGQQLDGRFTITTRLGGGGMGTVYRGLQHSVGREVAIKVINARLSSDRVAAKRFLREAKLASSLSHANTVTMIDFGQTDDALLYLVMELLPGGTLMALLRDRGVLSLETTINLGVQICEALEAAHNLEIIHRDLKPANIMVVDDRVGRERLKILDFGLAKSLTGEDTTMTQSSVMLGTPAYMPPEIGRGLTVDARGDLYSLGVLLYHMLSGRLPFEAETANSMIAQHAHENPLPLDEGIPTPMRMVILRLLEKEPADRFQTAGEVRDALLSREHYGGVIAVHPPTSLSPVSIGSHGTAATLAVTMTDAQRRPGTELARARSNWKVLAIAGVCCAAAGGFGVSQLLGASDEAAAPSTRVAVAPEPTLPQPVTVPIDARLAEPVAPQITNVSITFKSVPSRATVWVDGAKIGVTPMTRAFPQGTDVMKVKLTKPGYRPFRDSLRPDRDRQSKVRLKKKRKRKPPKPPLDKEPF